jgi:hypothetical protein
MRTTLPIVELSKTLRLWKASKTCKLFISWKSCALCLFPTKINALNLKNPSFLKKCVKNGGKQTNSDKKNRESLKRENLCLTNFLNLNRTQIEKSYCVLKEVELRGTELLRKMSQNTTPPFVGFLQVC